MCPGDPTFPDRALGEALVEPGDGVLSRSERLSVLV
jgi:hypothetical protein